MAAPAAQRQQRRRRRGRQRLPPAALALALCLVALPLAAAAATKAAGTDDYVVVFKHGFDAGRVRALCSDHAADTRLAGLCRRRFSAVLNGFAGAPPCEGGNTF